jgi:hypothetical protein
MIALPDLWRIIILPNSIVQQAESIVIFGDYVSPFIFLVVNDIHRQLDKA